VNIQKELLVYYSKAALCDFALSEKLEKVHTNLCCARDSRVYDTPFSFVYAPYDDKTIARINELVREKKTLGYSRVLVIGIGGSSLGAQALTDALLSGSDTIRVQYADTVDPVESGQLYAQLECFLQNGEQLLLVMVSKTGTTIESLAHFSVFVELLKRYRASSYQQYVVVISTEASVLAAHAHERGYSFLSIPGAIGGRYSVFTAAGLFVLAALGVDIDQLCSGARYILDTHFDQSLVWSSAAKSALCIYQNYCRGAIVLDYFIFSKVCCGIGAWFRQLVGESLGKKSVDGIARHIVPTVSIGSNDLHAVAQLYLGGQPPLFTQFVTFDSYQTDKTIAASEFGQDLSHLTYSALMNVFFDATQRAYDELANPYLHMRVPALTPFYVGQLLQFHMLQVVYLGALLQVNQFDQPQVELYKKYVRESIRRA